METKSINVNNTSKDSFLKTQADCSVNQGGYTIYKPINKITWGDDKINLKCGNSFKTKNIKTLRGPSRGYPWNQYLYMYFINGAKAICDNEPLLGMKFITDSNGKYSIEYICPNDDSMKFSQVKILKNLLIVLQKEMYQYKIITLLIMNGYKIHKKYIHVQIIGFYLR